MAHASRCLSHNLAPGTSAPFRPVTAQKLAQFMAPGPAGLPPQGAAVQAGPPGPPAAIAGQQNPKQARNLPTPNFAPGTAEGIRSAAQKVAEYSFRAGVAGHKNEAWPNWLENTLDAV